MAFEHEGESWVLAKGAKVREDGIFRVDECGNGLAIFIVVVFGRVVVEVSAPRVCHSFSTG